jgi:phosphoribosylformimino-5-aminoimidazole carboxamide ribotide isomerase
VDIYPAIDIENGRVARTAAGERDDPLALAEAYTAEGARWVHVVDMDRALDTGGENDRLVRRLCGLSGVAVQVGGNITDSGWAGDMVDAGAARVVLGSAAAVEPGRLAQLVSAVGIDHAAVALDVRRGAPLLAELRDIGVRTVLYRDLARDGTLGGTELEGAAALAQQGFEVIAAGGVASLQELEAAARLGLNGVIVGRALLEGRFTLSEAIACLG